MTGVTHQRSVAQRYAGEHLNHQLLKEIKTHTAWTQLALPRLVNIYVTKVEMPLSRLTAVYLFSPERRRSIGRLTHDAQGRSGLVQAGEFKENTEPLGRLGVSEPALALISK